MSETHYWPGEDEPGFFNIDHKDGLSRQAIGACWGGMYWILADEDSFLTTRSLEERGFIGVRREKPEPEKEPKPDNAAIAKQALAELRLCRKPFQTERWAYEWGPKLCAILGAG